MSRKNKSQFGEEEIVCKYRLQHDSNKVTMIADCKECGVGGKANLNNRTCLTGILNGLSLEYNVDSIILSHYTETKYADASMEILRMMVEVVHDLEQMSIREPFKEYFASDEELTSSQKNQQKITCERCGLRPESLFNSLKKHFLGDLNIFYAELNNHSKHVEDNEEDACAKCMQTIKSDLIYLFNKLENFRAYVIYKGFQIVI